MKLTEEQLETLVRFADEYDYNFRESYSARGMIGDNCVGFVVDDLFKLGWDLSYFLGKNDEELDQIFDSAHSNVDSMGKNIIVYFPIIKA